MPTHKTLRLSIIIGAYLFAAAMLFSLVLLAWTYKSSEEAADREVLSRFEQSYAVASTILEHQGDLLSITLNHIASNRDLQKTLARNNFPSAEEQLQRLLIGGGDRHLDFLIFTLHNNTIPVRADSPFRELAPFFPALTRDKHSLLTNPRILYFSSDTGGVSVLAKSTPVVHVESGHVMGTLIGGIVLNDNFALLESIRRRIQAHSVMLVGPEGQVGSTDLMDPGPGRTVLNASRTPEVRLARNAAEFDTDFIRLPGNLIARAVPLVFHRRATGLRIIFTVSNTPFSRLRHIFLVKLTVISAAACLFFLFTIMVIRRLTVPSLKRLLAFSETVRTTNAETGYEPGPILEFNRLGTALETMVADLNRSRRYADDILNSMPFVLIGVNDARTVTHWNNRAAEMTGISSDKAKGEPLSRVFPRLEHHRELIAEALRTRSPKTASKVPYHDDGVLNYENITIFPLTGVSGAVILVENVTERVRMDEVMVQTEKMLSVGGLAAGMAHEINNPLGIILQGAQSIERRMAPGIKGNAAVAEELDLDLKNVASYMERRGVLRYLEGIKEAGSRAAEIVRNMLEFSRKSESRMAPTDIRDIIERSLELAAADYDLKTNYDFKRIEIRKNFATGLPKIPLTRTELEQVILNIVKNAAQAIVNKRYTDEKPTITITTARDQGMIRVDIADNGTGMDEKVRKRIFEPFYTTKPVGTGTGLGLSVSYFIITQNHGGEFRVQSTPGQGAVFSLLLPIKHV